ncbi:MAG: hypothetical protein QY314_01985 [Candidatus Dojkabacteria bacterium]|nr:MAG: hypothetical protein QY314_01985 [Candidatus Dojkabacteria bacterium]
MAQNTHLLIGRIPPETLYTRLWDKIRLKAQKKRIKSFLLRTVALATWLFAIFIVLYTVLS